MDAWCSCLSPNWLLPTSFANTPRNSSRKCCTNLSSNAIQLEIESPSSSVAATFSEQPYMSKQEQQHPQQAQQPWSSKPSIAWNKIDFSLMEQEFEMEGATNTPRDARKIHWNGQGPNDDCILGSSPTSLIAQSIGKEDVEMARQTDDDDYLEEAEREAMPQCHPHRNDGQDSEDLDHYTWPSKLKNARQNVPVEPRTITLDIMGFFNERQRSGTRTNSLKSLHLFCPLCALRCICYPNKVDSPFCSCVRWVHLQMREWNRDKSIFGECIFLSANTMSLFGLALTS